MNIQNWTDEKLESRYTQIQSEIQALCSWANRNLSKKNRQEMVEDLQGQQDQILQEQMKRDGVVA